MITPSTKRSLLTCGLVALAATIVMLPRLALPHFGLLDDGALPIASAAVVRQMTGQELGAVFQIESRLGLFRPVYWFSYGGQYLLWGANPLTFFLSLYLGLVATSLLVAGAIVTATKDPRAGLLGGLAFVLSPPVVENYYTASKAEPILVLCLALSVFFLYRALDVADRDTPQSRRRLAAAAVFLLLGYLSKETAHAMILVSGLWTVSAWWRRRQSGDSRRFGVVRWYFIANLACAGIYWGAVALSGTAGIAAGGYSSGYALAPGTMIQSLLRHVAFYIRDFPLFLILGGVWVATAMRARDGEPSPVRWLVVDCASWIVGWTAVMLPWHSTLEYRLLPVSIGVSMATGILLSAFARQEYRATRRMGWVAKGTLIAGLGLTLVVVINDVTNARIQLTIDASNMALIDHLASHTPPNGTVLVNLPEPSEYVWEVGQHLAAFRGRSDVKVHYFNGSGDVAPGTLVATPLMRHQPFPTVRLGFYENGVPEWSTKLSARLGDRTTLVYRKVERVPLLYVALEEPVCPILLAADVQDGVYCGTGRPVFDRRVFQYGWDVYVVGPVAGGPRAGARMTPSSTRSHQGNRLTAGGDRESLGWGAGRLPTPASCATAPPAFPFSNPSFCEPWPQGKGFTPAGARCSRYWCELSMLAPTAGCGAPSTYPRAVLTRSEFPGNPRARLSGTRSLSSNFPASDAIPGPDPGYLAWAPAVTAIRIHPAAGAPLVRTAVFSHGFPSHISNQ